MIIWTVQCVDANLKSNDVLLVFLFSVRAFCFALFCCCYCCCCTASGCVVLPEDVPLMAFTYHVFTRMTGVSYRRRLGSLLCLCDVFRALISSRVCLFVSLFVSLFVC